MSEKLCLQWNDFKENAISAFGSLRNDKEFTNVTLACEDGQQMEAHKVILAASSPFFEKILQKSQHPHPLIYLKGFQSKNLLPILDFIYFGGAKVYQEDLDAFLAIAEEIQLKGLTGQTSSDFVKEQGKTKFSEPIHKSKDFCCKPTTSQPDIMTNANVSTNTSIPDQSRTDPQAHDEKNKALMEKHLNNVYTVRNLLHLGVLFMCI